MTEVKFTPGPWSWVVHDHSMASLGVLPDPGFGDPLVLCVGPCSACAKRAAETGKGWEWGLCHTPSLADARLIAAAPDMLAALKAMDAALCDGFDTQSARMAGRKALIATRAAVAKAEGTSS